jgi:hypothetical protein
MTLQIKGEKLVLLQIIILLSLNAATSIFANSSSSSDSAGSCYFGLALNTVDVNTFAGTTDLSYGSADREKC